MPQSTNHRRIRSLLDDLKPYLAAFVTSIHRRGEYELASADTQALLNVMIANWDATFSQHLTRTSRSYIFELKDIRNRWAHEVEFSDEDVRRARDTAALLAASIGAPAKNRRSPSRGAQGNARTRAASAWRTSAREIKTWRS